MVSWILEHVDGAPPDVQERFRRVLIALSAEAQLQSQRAMDSRDSALIAAGAQSIRDPKVCGECHLFHDAGMGSPDLTGYASRSWMLAFVNDPAHTRFYGDNNDRMPSYGPEKSLTDNEIGLVVDWLRGEWFVPRKE